MTAITLDTLTDDDHAAIEKHLADYAGYGWKPVASAKSYAPGVRIRHRGQQYPQAYWHGTGIIVTVLERGNTIELVVAFDKPRFEGGSRITVLGDYHVDLGPFEGAR